MSRKQSAMSSDYDRPTLKRGDVAVKINASVSTVKRLVKKNLLTEFRLPSATGDRSLPRYSQAAVDAYLSSGYQG